MLCRDYFENDYVPLFEQYRYGTIIYSPVAGGFSSGRYNKEIIPNDSKCTTLPF